MPLQAQGSRHTERMGNRRTLPVSARLLTGVILAGTLSVLDSTIIVPLLTRIGEDFGAQSEVAWLVAAYLLGSTVTIPLWGRWHDVRGERTAMWAALSLFTLATLLAAVAPTLPVLIAARALQGVGAGGIVPLGQAILAHRCSTEERARMQIYYNVAYGVAAGLGPLLGGFLAGISWRWAFVIILPFCLAVGAALWRQLDSAPPGAQPTPFDWRGSALLTAGLTALLVGIERSHLWFLGPIGLVLIVAFALGARSGPNALIPWPVLGSRVILACSFLGLIVGLIQFSYLTYLPALSLQVAPTMNSGLVAVPLTVLWMTLGAFTGVLAIKVGTKILTIASAACAMVAGLLVAGSGALPSLFLASLLIGATAGLTLIPALLLAQHSTQRENMGATTSMFVLCRNFGGALGVVVTAGVLEAQGRQVTFLMLAVCAAAMLIPISQIPGRTNYRPGQSW